MLLCFDSPWVLDLEQGPPVAQPKKTTALSVSVQHTHRWVPPMVDASPVLSD